MVSLRGARSHPRDDPALDLSEAAHKPDLFDRCNLSGRMLADAHPTNHLNRRVAAASSIEAFALTSTALKDK
jgi:hypothetical protein